MPPNPSTLTTMFFNLIPNFFWYDTTTDTPGFLRVPASNPSSSTDLSVMLFGRPGIHRYWQRMNEAVAANTVITLPHLQIFRPFTFVIEPSQMQMWSQFCRYAASWTNGIRAANESVDIQSLENYTEEGDAQVVDAGTQMVPAAQIPEEFEVAAAPAPIRKQSRPTVRPKAGPKANAATKKAAKKAAAAPKKSGADRVDELFG